ncbi:MAG: UDP-N-acetylmuramate dehydrogenase [Bacteroidia bacterium]
MSNSNSTLSLKNYNTFGIDVNAKEIIKLDNLDQLKTIQKLKECFFIGGGSNILLTGDVNKIVIINETKGITIVSEDHSTVELAVASGENWHELVLYSIEKGYGGLENMSLIPGSVGAAPMQNIGAYGKEVKDVLTYVKAVNLTTLEEETFSNEDCKFGYRESIFKKEAKGKYFISEVGIQLTKTDHLLNTSYGDIENWLTEQNISSPSIKDISNAVIAIRQSKLPDPAELGNSGSFFKNPIIHRAHLNMLKMDFPDIKSYKVSETLVKVPAGWLIESLGWKGRRVGRTGSHAKQALVLVNYGGARGKDVYKLAQDIQEDVWEEYQIQLEMEVNVI